ncbi:TPA: ferrochelatase, partial [Campylobacter jejuni]|nr:ferrochelatase [Campylobacter jejuni]
MKLVLFLNMGGATNLQDCEVFLKNMFNDPYILGIKNRFLRK